MTSCRWLTVGSAIEARYKKGLEWYPGVVRAVNDDGSYVQDLSRRITLQHHVPITLPFLVSSVGHYFTVQVLLGVHSGRQRRRVLHEE